MPTRGRIQDGFARDAPFRGTFMVFGGNRVNELWREATFAYLGGIPLDAARTIAAQHPDFHLCASPGAALARHAMVDMLLVGVHQAMRATASIARSGSMTGASRGTASASA